MPEVQVRDADTSQAPDDVVPVRMERPVCACHGEPMYVKDRRDIIPSWQCAVKKRERMRNYYHRRKQDPAWLESRRQGQRERWPQRSSNPVYKLQRQLNEMTRIRVSY